MAVAFSDSGEAAINRHVAEEPSSHERQFDNSDNLEVVFEVLRCAQWIKKKELKRPTLQFPDSLLYAAPAVAKKLEEEVGQRVSILGDTSFGECCVDEVAAEHIGADGVIHFGNTCLTPTSRLPVLHIFTSLPLDADDFLGKCGSILEEAEGRLFVYYDVRYHGCLSRLTLPSDRLKLCAPADPDSFGSKRTVCARCSDEDVRSEDNVLYCGFSDSFALLLALTFSSNRHYSYDPRTKALTDSRINISGELRRRYFLVEKAKDSERIGVLVGTLGASQYRDVIDRLTDSIRRAGKKAYTFLVGKLNVPKLANFAEIDVFVLVACPETSIISSKDFLRPVITPFELDVALNAKQQWTGQFWPNYRDILPEGRSFASFEAESPVDGDFSLISGKMRAVALENSDCGSRALSAQETGVSLLHEGGGGQFLSERSWKGLEPKLGESAVAKATKGMGGVPVQYDGESFSDGPV